MSPRWFGYRRTAQVVGRFLAILVLAFVGFCWCLFFADYMQRVAFVAAFGVALLLPHVLNPTRHWARGFFICFDIVYAASCLGAYVAAYASHPSSFAEFLAGVSRLEVFVAALIPALLCGPMASLGVGRSGLADLELERLRREIGED